MNATAIALRNLLAAVTAGQQHLDNDPRVKAACAALADEALLDARRAEARRKNNDLAEGGVFVTGTPVPGHPGSRNPYDGGYPPEPACIDDFGIKLVIAGKEFDLGMYPDLDKLCIEIESAVLDEIAAGDDDEPIDTRND